jgi:hypothetical protein
MPLLDFKEIPKANVANGEQDTFELFARDFLELCGYKILSGPDRGADGGRDLIAAEIRTGVGGQTEVKWLVSCKHKAHSGQSVTLDDETDILDRVIIHKCKGFIGFYSTLPASSITQKLEGIRTERFIEFQIFDRERIERELFKSSDGLDIVRRYLPSSFTKWHRENPQPVKIFHTQRSLNCDYCGKDLLDPKDGIVVLWRKANFDEDYENYEREYVDIYWCCKDVCDQRLKYKYRERGLIDGWEDIPDITIPTVYIKWIMGIINQQHNGVKYTEHALNRLKEFMLVLFPYISREQTSKEKEEVADRLTLPSILGGFE